MPKRSPEAAASNRDSPNADDALRAIARRHLAFGWWCLAFFSAFGLLLEAAHGLKLGAYLDVGNATRRLSFTLGHAHGTLLGLVNLAYGLSLPHARTSAAAARRTSGALRLATVLMPLGFIVGGVVIYAGDPGLGIVLVPPGGVLLVYALVQAARGFASTSDV